MQAVLKVVEKTGNTGKEASDTLAGDKTGRLCGSIAGALGGTFHLCKGILQLLDVIAGVLHGLFQFLASYLLLGISFFSVSDSIFGEWMSFMLPYTIIVLFIAWFILLRLFPFKQKSIELQIEGEAKKDWRSIVVYITFAITVLLWMFDKFTGVNSNVVAMIPVAVFCITGVITKRDLEEISWSVLWMVAGGFALGVALQETGLAKHMIEAIPFSTWPPVLMIVGSGLICYAMANFISHTATAALLVPILAIAGISMRENLSSLGGVETLLIGVAIGSSLAMILPISTPPNALAHATGMIQQKDMEKVGIIMGIIGLILGYTMLIILGSNKLL